MFGAPLPGVGRASASLPARFDTRGLRQAGPTCGDQLAGPWACSLGLLAKGRGLGPGPGPSQGLKAEPRLCLWRRLGRGSDPRLRPLASAAVVSMREPISQAIAMVFHNLDKGRR